MVLAEMEPAPHLEGKGAVAARPTPERAPPERRIPAAAAAAAALRPRISLAETAAARERTLTSSLPRLPQRTRIRSVPPVRRGLPERTASRELPAALAVFGSSSTIISELGGSDFSAN